MEAHDRSLSDVFNHPIRYIVPLFQRPYVWKRDSQWEPLWLDIQETAERRLKGETERVHFLGAIVLNQIQTSTGDVPAREVIDGQQRLTTLQILFAAIRDIAKANSFEKLTHIFTGLTTNHPLIPGSDKSHQYKVWPTNKDQLHFQKIMESGSPGSLKEDLGVRNSVLSIGTNLADAYLYFHSTVASWLNEDAEENREIRLSSLSDAIWSNLVLVVIDLNKGDDPQVIFETLNARGTPLLPADLVKNFLFHRARSETKDLDALYAEGWKNFDSKEWRAEVTHGRQKRPMIDIFLQHYLSLKTRNEVNVAHLFSEYKAYYSSIKDSSAISQIQDLSKYSARFQGFYSMPADTEDGKFFRRLDTLDTTTVIPFLLALVDEVGSLDDRPMFLQVLRDIESFLIRRMVCGLTSKAYNHLFTGLLGQIQSKKALTGSTVREYLLKGTDDTNRWPTDEEFKKYFCLAPLYENLRRDRLRMILEAVNEASRTDKTENFKLISKLEVEHLMPRQWETHWPLPEGVPSEESAKTRDHLVHTIGNLTLITKKLNSSIGNGPWTMKRIAILQHSAIHLNRHFIGKEMDVWDEKKIAERAIMLFTIAQNLWPRPAV